MPSGRFAPSPTGRLHLGNLRTALAAWLFARADGSAFHLRFEDLDRPSVRAEHYRTQAEDLLALGLGWDGDPIRQSDRSPVYADALARLTAAGHTYPCYCTRREVREAASAPNGPSIAGRYPGTCRHLDGAARARREASGRRAALRLRGPSDPVDYEDVLLGPGRRPVDDVVLCRNDGTPAYNLAVVVDDADLGVELVVRGDDLLDSAAAQVHLGRLLDLRSPRHAHVPLVLGPEGRRLAKRDGAVTLADRVALGESPGEVLSHLAFTLGQVEEGEPTSTEALRARFDPTSIPRRPLVFDSGVSLSLSGHTSRRSGVPTPPDA